MAARHEMTWRSIRVAGRTARYGVAGHGDPVLFVHGWGLGASVYATALERLAGAGKRVYAPFLPGFGGTAALPGYAGIGCYARWVADFADAVGIDRPATVIGHSFGGGVAIRLAHDHPDLVEHLVPVNSVGGATWADNGVLRPLRDRPLWAWGLCLGTEVNSRHGLRTAPRIARATVSNVLRNPAAVWQAANLARAADLRPELTRLRQRGLPVTVLWSEDDTVIPPASRDALLAALGEPPCVRVPGRHGWLIDDPRRFASVVRDVLTHTPAESLDVAA